MPLYEYKCSTCQNIYEIQHGIKEPKKTFCEECKTDTLERLISEVMGFTRREAKTLGQLGERNRKKIGKYKISEHQEQSKLRPTGHVKDKETFKKIKKMDAAQKQKYIMTGKS